MQDMCASYRKRRDIAVATLERNNMAPAAIPGGAFYMLLPCRTDGVREDSAAFVL
jgi:aspartate/methionine/tyrosine aminotransferase